MRDMQDMIDELVSQAEREGVALAEIINRELGPKDIDSMQRFLSEELSKNYKAIEHFMSDIEIPGTYDFSSMDEDSLCSLQEELRGFLSDAPLLAESGI